MTILLTGTAGLLRRSAIDALARASHEVRVLAPDAAAIATEWPAHVEPWPCGPGATEATSVADACRGCEAVILLNDPAETRADTGEGSEDGVQLDDIRRLVDAASTAGVPRLIYVAPIGSPNEQATASSPSGDSPSHPRLRSAAEEAIQHFPRDWLIMRHAPVYGPGDPIVSRLLVTMRSLPAVPLVDVTQRLTLLWHSDLAEALAIATEAARVQAAQTIDIAGPDSATLNDLYEHIGMLIDRRPPRIPVPAFVGTYGAQIADLLHLRSPAIESMFASIPDSASAVVPREASDSLRRIFNIDPTPLQEGLRRLVDEQDEQVPAEGIGSVEIKRFWADIRGSQHDAASLMALFKQQFREIMPIPFGVEPASSNLAIAEGLTLTAQMPLRGHVQVRVEEATDQRVTLATLRGHPMSGIVRFSTEDVPGGVHFEVLTCDRASNPLDWVMLTFGGAHGQSLNWRMVVQNVVKASGGSSDGVERAREKFTEDDEIERIDGTIRAIIGRRRASEQSHAAL